MEGTKRAAWSQHLLPFSSAQMVVHRFAGWLNHG
jgi:hypothetical protein